MTSVAKSLKRSAISFIRGSKSIFLSRTFSYNWLETPGALAKNWNAVSTESKWFVILRKSYVG